MWVIKGVSKQQTNMASLGKTNAKCREWTIILILPFSEVTLYMKMPLVCNYTGPVMNVKQDIMIQRCQAKTMSSFTSEN